MNSRLIVGVSQLTADFSPDCLNVGNQPNWLIALDPLQVRASVTASRLNIYDYSLIVQTLNKVAGLGFFMFFFPLLKKLFINTTKQKNIPIFNVSFTFK